MDHFFNEGSPFYHRFLARYSRSVDGTLHNCNGPAEACIRREWESLSQRNLAAALTAGTFLAKSATIPTSDHLATCNSSTQGLSSQGSRVQIFEFRQLSSSIVTGLVIVPGTKQTDAQLDNRFARLVLQSYSSLESSVRIPAMMQGLTTAEAVTSLFESTVRHEAVYDEWESVGRRAFREKIKHFVSRGVMIEFCLPAFPCKSSNLGKVGGAAPDRGEHIALETLHAFVHQIEDIYHPGATIWIISDGHVFSDCIGVDDRTVDTYSRALKQMNNLIAERTSRHGRIRFCSLADLFKPATDLLRSDEDKSACSLPDVPHHLDVNLDREAEFCRRLLMAGFGPEPSVLRTRIDHKDPTVLALYRGFSRFMFEDLDKNEYTVHLSKSQRRKLSSKVAFEMIKRNQAYSNLIEALLPHHVRLSIHAHSNAGPKFGINLLGSNVRATGQLSNDGEPDAFSNILHVPTPWHGCIAEIKGHHGLYITKAHVVMESLSRGLYTGGWQSGNDSYGGYFSLVPTQQLQRRSSSSEDRSSIASASTEDEKASHWISSTEGQGQGPTNALETNHSNSWLRKFMALLCMI